MSCWGSWLLLETMLWGRFCTLAVKLLISAEVGGFFELFQPDLLQTKNLFKHKLFGISNAAVLNGKLKKMNMK